MSGEITYFYSLVTHSVNLRETVYYVCRIFEREVTNTRLQKQFLHTTETGTDEWVPPGWFIIISSAQIHQLHFPVDISYADLSATG